MVDPFGEISFLTRSENRVEVLTTLADAPQTNRELVEATGISDVTVGRIVEDFAERGWIRETDDGHATTPLGDLLAEDYARLEDSMNVAARLGPVLEHLPVAEMDFDFRHLTDARISDPDDHDALRAIDRWVELIRESDRIVGTSDTPVETVTAVLHEEVTGGTLDYEAIYTAESVREIQETPPMDEMHAEMLRAGATVYRADEDAGLPHIISLCDDLATVAGMDDERSFRVGIETRAEPIREWIRDTYEAYRTGATRLGPEDFGG